MKKRCEHFIKSEDGYCKNYTGNKMLKSDCKRECKFYKLTNRNEERLKRQLEAQIVGIEVPYDLKK